MKFAKELEQDAVPEWRAKYVDYKGGKKKIKKIAQAVKKTRATPKTPANSLPANGIQTSPTSRRTPLRTHVSHGNDATPNIRSDIFSTDRESRTERESLRHSPESNAHRYGSIITPPTAGPPLLDLPGPAMNPLQRSASVNANPTPNAFQVGKTTSPRAKNPFVRRVTNLGPAASEIPNTKGNSPRNFLQRIASGSWTRSPWSDAELQAIDAVAVVERTFVKWMQVELDKVESFYKEMETKNEDRLRILRDQLHKFHARRLQELSDNHREHQSSSITPPTEHKNVARDGSNGLSAGWFGPLRRALVSRPGDNSRALQRLTTSPSTFRAERHADGHSAYLEAGRDYVQRRIVELEGPNYRSAKRKLKTAMQEFYRGLELLKAYGLLNRTAFRKINKKYDKAVSSQRPLRYLSEHVNNAYFVRSEKTDAHMLAVEDLYSRYFEGGKRKIAVGKLRSLPLKRPDYYLFGITNGLMVGIGAVFAIQGLTFAIQILLNNSDSVVRNRTAYLLQLYGGYFLCLYLFSWFCFDCMVWSKHKINYPFVFELDAKHRLDWQELINFPSFFLLLLGLFLWLNFSGYGKQAMFIWYPVILIGVTAVVIFFPFPELFYKSRQWFIYSHWRLICSVTFLYSVEFRDFFLGDMYGSLTYATANIELFFCLYIPTDHWLSPGQCNSSNTSYRGRLLGFCSALPAIWRACQCLRRYQDSGDKYPHLANCGKYMMTILYYTTLSLYRMNNHPATKASFIVMAAINAVYVTFWDLVNDWSLCQPNSSARFLRDTRGFKSTWWYYTAMAIDPILRFNWIFYVIYTHNAGHASLVSFLIAFSEATRRGMWTLFRVENEHCTNVGHYRAYRDIALPYKLEDESTESVDPDALQESEEEVTEPIRTESVTAAPSGTPALSHRRPTLRQTATAGSATGSGSGRQGAPIPYLRRQTGTWTQMLAEGHAKDFVKKKPDNAPVDLEANYRGRRHVDSDEDSDESDSSPVPQRSDMTDQGTAGGLSN